MPAVEEACLPLSALERFGEASAQASDRMRGFLNFLSPLSVGPIGLREGG